MARRAKASITRRIVVAVVGDRAGVDGHHCPEVIAERHVHG